jgi:signal transduction histidine kinase
MSKLPKITIRQKLRTAMLVTVGVALLIASVAFVSFETLASRNLQKRELSVVADLVEANAAAALTFEDADQAEAALAPLRRQEGVQAASLFTTRGTMLAGFQRPDGKFRLPPPEFRDTDRIWSSQGRLQMVRSIHLHGRKVGTLCLTADLSALRRAFLWGAGAVLVIAALSFLAAYLTSRPLLRDLAGPLAQLAGAARAVAKDHDYGLRVEPRGQDELGLLMEDFNAMLAEIEQRNLELRGHREQLEDLVRARTRELEQDMAERKSLEKQLLRVQRMESLGTLAGGVAHDLNNVLSPIVLSIQLLQEQASDDQERKILSIIESSALRGSEIVKQILTFARGTEGERALVDFPALYRELAAIIRQTFPKNISLQLDLMANPHPVVGDASQIHQLLLNLCVNARDAMGKGGQLTLGLFNSEVPESQAKLRLGAQPGPYVVLMVADTGCGMGPQTLDRMFEPFFTTKETGKGTGLGLSTVHTITRSHGGFMRCTSEVGKGTTFQVFLPASASGDGTEEPRTRAVPARIHGSGERILVVDDEAFVREMTRHTLETFGYQAVTAVNGSEALALYAGRPEDFALVLTDMMMPVMDGARTIAALRAVNPQVRIIATSGLQAGDLAGSAKHAGADRFLAKPFSAEKLLQAIQELLAP